MEQINDGHCTLKQEEAEVPMRDVCVYAEGGSR